MSAHSHFGCHTANLAGISRTRDMGAGPLVIALLVLVLHAAWALPASADATSLERTSPLKPQSSSTLVRIPLETPAAAERLVSLDLDIWELHARSSLVLLEPEQVPALAAAGFTWTVVRDVSRDPADYRPAAAPSAWLTFTQFESTLQAWATGHSDIVSLVSIGTTHEGRNLWLLKISDNVAVDEDEPEVALIALQHAREWLAGMTLYGVAEFFVEQYGTDSRATEIVDSTELFVLLVANPDGYVYTHTTDRYWRKNRRDNGDGSYGVDLNRNFPWKWETGSSTPSSTTYRGPSVLSEPENSALAQWIASRPRPIAGLINYHTYGAHVMHNWAYTYAEPSNIDVMGPLARQMAFEMEAVNGQRYINGSWSVTLEYTGGGATIDYLQAQLGIPSLTLELRPGDGQSGGFAPSTDQIQPSISENIPGAIYFIQWVRDRANDTTPPSLSDVSIVKVSDRQATFVWTTDVPCDQGVEWGTDASLGSFAQPDRLPSRTHTVTVTGLAPSTTYSARAVSRSLSGLRGESPILSFTTAAVPQDIAAPTPPTLLALRRTGESNQVEIRWSPSPSSDVAGYRVYGGASATTGTLLADENVLNAAAESFTWDFTGWTGPAVFWVTAVDNAAVPNESISSDAYAVRPFAAQTRRVLIVDGYDRWPAKPVANGRNHAFAADHGLALAPWGIPFDSCANEAVGGAGSQVLLAGYAAVLWMVGDESSTDETFSAAEQTLVSDYLKAGGNFMTSGSEIAWDLDRSSGPTAADRAFFNSFLSADYSIDNTARYDASGISGTLFDGRTVRFDDGSRGIYRVDTPDAVLPLNGAVTTLRTDTSRTVAVSRQGVFPGGAAPARLVYLAFPFETIFPATGREEIMGDVMQFFELTPVYSSVAGWMLH